MQVINNTFYWVAFIIYRPEFADWSKTFLKVFFIFWHFFRNNFPNACCNWSTYIFSFQFLVKQMFVVIAEAVSHRCSCIWSITVINVKRNNFINNGQMSWGYFYFILFTFDQNLNSPKYGAQTYISKLSVYLWQFSVYFEVIFWSKYTVISSLIFCVQIVCEFDFFNKLLIILKFSQQQWTFKIWNICFVLLFLKLLLHIEDLYHERWFRFSTCKLFASFAFSTKSWSLLNSPNINKNLLFEVIIVFCYFYTFSHMYIVRWGLIHWKVFLPLLLFTKKLGRSTYDVTMTHYDVIVILFLFRFVANAQD